MTDKSEMTDTPAMPEEPRYFRAAFAPDGALAVWKEEYDFLRAHAVALQAELDALKHDMEKLYEADSEHLAELAAAKRDAERWRWAKLILSGDGGPLANSRTLGLAAELMAGKDVDTAVDAAMGIDASIARKERE